MPLAHMNKMSFTFSPSWIDALCVLLSCTNIPEIYELLVVCNYQNCDIVFERCELLMICNYKKMRCDNIHKYLNNNY